ncbi:hypothetical protein EW093_11265 [Thiospirochaeta perfilievii]|uniref:DUF481 domain-containing protein n=1 Tax=Thiospirochaeta perfilievii TaxID=252967 RepID=A0A5C1QCX4_9SPIO|nr:hypothetical protein [Thiospirochaeta perfilievii]QEN05267.1 hypothetical protein EW093_11265 [Thiospirochaeta perfilievii]
MLLLSFVNISAEDHQRLGVEKRRKHLITPSIGLSFNCVNGDTSYDIYLDSNLSVSYKYMNYLSISLNQEFSRVTTTRKTKNGLALGDCGASLSLYKNFGDYWIRGDLGYSYPLGIHNNYQANVRNIMSGDGYHKPNIAISLSKIIDPTILNLSIDYTLRLFKKSRFKTVSTLGVICFNGGITEVLNDKLGYNIKFINSIYLPKTDFNKTKWNDTTSYMSINFSFFYYIDKLAINTGVNSQFDSGSINPNTEIATSYDIEF